MSEAYSEGTQISVNMDGSYLDIQLISGIRQLIVSHDYQLSTIELMRIRKYTESIIDELIVNKGHNQ